MNEALTGRLTRGKKTPSHHFSHAPHMARRRLQLCRRRARAAVYCHFLPTVFSTRAAIVSVCLSKLFVYTCQVWCRSSACCLCWQCTVKAASVLHDKLFRRLLLSPMRFFDTTPLGRILTRFSRDMDEGEAWFVSTENLSLRRALSQWSHCSWQGVVPTHGVIWHDGISLVSCSLSSTSLVSLLDMSICELFSSWMVALVFLLLADFLRSSSSFFVCFLG